MRAPMWSWVAHRTPTRIRIKIANPRTCRFFAAERVLVEHPDVLGVQLNPLTASLIVNCRRGFELSARHRQLLGLEMEQPKGALSASHRARRAAQPGDGFDSGLILLRLFELIVAISNKQIAAQLTEWAVNGLVQVIMQEVRPRAADREPLLIAK